MRTPRDAIIITRLDGTVVDVNQAALQLFGYSRMEMMGMNTLRLFADESQRKPRLRELMEKGLVPDKELRLRRKDGSELDCLATSALQHDNASEVIGAQAIIHDITDQKRAEEALRLHSQELEALHFIANTLARPGVFEEKCVQVLEELVKVTQGNRATLRVPDDKAQCLRLTASAGQELELRSSNAPHPLFPGRFGKGLRHGEARGG